jgi:transcriptional regulator GlxA family with amidase domain
VAETELNPVGLSPRHVSLVAIPDAAVSTLFGIFDVMNVFARLSPAGATPFHIEIVGETVGPLDLASGVPINVQRAIDTIETSDIVIVPSVVLGRDGWPKGRYPRLVEWLQRMYDRGAVLCSACSGIFLLAETGLFDGRNATVHFR